MESIEIHEFRCATLYLEDGIIYTIFKKECDVDLIDVIEINKIRDKMLNANNEFTSNPNNGQFSHQDTKAQLPNANVSINRKSKRMVGFDLSESSFGKIGVILNRQ